MYAKMAKNDILLDEEKRLSDEEFLELLPCLEPYEYFMVQVKLQENWKHLFWYNRTKSTVTCAVCGVKLYYNAYIDHAQKDANHLHALKNVEQFYHPAYTYGKNWKKLAQGQKVFPSEMRESIANEKAELAKTFQYDCTSAQRIVKDLENAEPQDTISKMDKRLISLALNSNITEAEKMCIKIGIPLSALQIMEYCIHENEWKSMLTSKDWTEKGLFYCNLCSKYCAGILTVNAHLNGWQHKSLQIKTIAVRVRSFKHLTKNCCFRYSKQYTVCLKDNAKDILKPFMHEDIDDNQRNIKHEGVEMKCENTMKREKYLSPAIAAKAQTLLSLAQQTTKTADQSSLIERVEDEGLIGVEYVIKMIKSADDETPMYECCLCNVGMNELRMQNHLISYNHRLKYCEIHYPDTLNKYKTKIGSLKYYDYFRVMGPILAKLAWAIEQHHGRSLPYTIHVSKLTKSRGDINSKVFGFLHACQTHGPSFANIISKQEIENFVSNKEGYKPSIASNNIQRKFTVASSDKIYLNQRHYDPNVREEDRLKKLTKTTKSSTNNIHSNIKRARSRSPRNQCVTEKRSSVSKDKSTEVEILYKKYRGNPECHPLYDKEWDTFWRRRKEELILQGIDHRSYNYQPEWVQFFRGRLEELFEEDIMEEKTTMKQQSEKIHVSPARSLHMAPKQSSDRVQYHQDNNEEYGQLSPPRKRSRNEESNLNTRWDTLDAQPSSSMQWSHNFNPHSQSQIQSLTDGKANVIHCLRLLVAFEDHLGSLGSKVMDLLSKALVFEKSYRNPRELEEKILDAANCTLLETAMEKLKGILYAGLLDDNKVVGFNRVITHTSELLQHADKMGWRTIPPETSEKVSSHVQLDQLINAVKSKRINLTSSTEKSLSDTLMELMSARKPNNSSNNVQNCNSVAMNTNASGSGSYHSNTSGSNQSFGRINENNDIAQYNYTASSKNNNNVGNFNMNRGDNMLSNFNTSLTTDNQMLRPADGFGIGAGRNNYNNQYNNYNRSTNFGYQSEYGQGQSSSNMNVTNNGKSGYRNQLGNNSNNSSSGSGGSNWKGFRNNEQW